jgi:hypothetical protein
MTSVVPDRTFFATQQRFAERWADLASMPVETAYLECTTWYHQAAGLGRDFDPSHPDWQRLVAEVAVSPEPDAVVHAWAVAHRQAVGPGAVLDFAWSAEDRTVRINFLGERSRSSSPLSEMRLSERRRELRDLVLRAADRHPEAELLRGRSWLYGLEAYRRIFPPVFLAGLDVEPPDLQFLAIWGQLLYRDGSSRLGNAAGLLVAADAASSTTDLERSFPVPMWQTTAPFAAVADALGITHRC